MPPSISVSLSVSHSVSLGHFHSVCSSTPSPFVHMTVCHSICLDKEGLARCSFGNGLRLHQWLNWDASEDVSLALGRCSWRWRGCSFNQNGDCFLFVQTCLLMSMQCDSKDNLQYCFLHTLCPTMLHFQTCICSQSTWDSRTFWHKWFIVAQALMNYDILKSLGESNMKCLQVALNCKTVKPLLFCYVIQYPCGFTLRAVLSCRVPGSDVTRRWPR